ncbi:MAG TPA: glutaminase A [Candidatus Acidoferrales bacterium]|nr:glutaminase A [Candidatus Acidoferrales bacterium]
MSATNQILRRAGLGLLLATLLMGQARSPVAPTPESVQATVREAYEKFKGDTTGKNADYIPFLAKVPSHLFGIVGMTTDGQTFTAGDIDYAFSIQSISKVFTLALAMEELGAAEVFKKIGCEPTGRPFNAVAAVEDLPGRTGNPFVNAGAIATTSLIRGANAAEKWNKILSFYSRVAGSRLELIDEVYKSEAATNAHNRGIAVLLESYERMYSDPLEATDIYTRQCSVGVSAKQLAMMGATLADNGRNPVTGQQVIQRENVPHILAAMTMAGLYDGSGGWAWTVGLPAKSGVGGGLLAIVPGKGAIVGFAPPLDQAGNSVKAQKAIAYIADKLGLNLFSPRSVGLN